MKQQLFRNKAFIIKNQWIIGVFQHRHLKVITNQQDKIPQQEIGFFFKLSNVLLKTCTDTRIPHFYPTTQQLPVTHAMKHCSTLVSLMLSQEQTIDLKELEYFQKFYSFRDFLRMFITSFLIINSRWEKIQIVWFFFKHLQWCNTGFYLAKWK